MQNPTSDLGNAEFYAPSGLIPATVTPFTQEGSLDLRALEKHLCVTLAAPGVTAVVVNSGIGELLQLTPEEQLSCIRLAKGIVGPEQRVISGVEGHNPDRLVAAAIAAREAGADALLVLPPFDRRAYRRLNAHPPSVRRLFERLDAEVNLPMIIFQYPQSSGSSYSMEALDAIVSLRNVVGIKTATEGNVETYREVWERFHDQVSILVGVDSPPLLEMIRLGSHGCLIGISAIKTESWGTLLRLVEEGRNEEAELLYKKVCLPLMDAVFQNQKPVSLMNEAAATKEALFQLGEIPSAFARFPAMMPDDKECAAIGSALSSAGLRQT